MPCSGHSWTPTGAHNPERATPIQGLCHGVFKDQFTQTGNYMAKTMFTLRVML